MSDLTTKDALLERMVAATDDLKENLANVVSVDSSGTNYIRYTNGIQICWGNEVAIDTSGTAIDFPVAFKDTNYAVGVTGRGVATSTNCLVPKLAGKWTTSFRCVGVATGNLSALSGGHIDYVAFGFWK